MSETKRPAWLLPGGIGVLVVALVVVALVREPVQLDSDTPEGTVQRYLQAISDEDYETAYELLHPDEFEDCLATDLARYAPNDPFTASLESDGTQNVGDDLEIVNVRLRFGTDGPFGSGWDTWESFEVVFENGEWWISGEPWPHFIWECQERGDF